MFNAGYMVGGLLGYMSGFGNVNVTGDLDVAGNLELTTVDKQILVPENSSDTPNIAATGDTDTGVAVSTTGGGVFIAKAGTRRVEFDGSVTTLWNIVASGAKDITGFDDISCTKLHLTETSTPTGVASTGILYAADDGSKTDVLAIFQTGSGVKFVEEV